MNVPIPVGAGWGRGGPGYGAEWKQALIEERGELERVTAFLLDADPQLPAELLP